MSFIFIANGLVVSSAGVLLTSMNADKTMIGVITSFFFHRSAYLHGSFS
nr:hypothetical protein [Campylobacter fetus]